MCFKTFDLAQHIYILHQDQLRLQHIKMTNILLELVTDMNLLVMLEKGIILAICHFALG